MSIRWTGLAPSQKKVLKYMKENPSEEIPIDKAYNLMGTRWQGNWKEYTNMRMRELVDKGLIYRDELGWKHKASSDDRGGEYIAEKTLF